MAVLRSPSSRARPSLFRQCQRSSLRTRARVQIPHDEQSTICQEAQGIPERLAGERPSAGSTLSQSGEVASAETGRRGLRPVGLSGRRSVARRRICEIRPESSAALRAPRLGQAVEIVAACFAQAGPIRPAPSSKNLAHNPATGQTTGQRRPHEAQHQEHRFKRTGEIGRHGFALHASKGRPHSGQRGFGSRRISYPQPAHRPTLITRPIIESVVSFR